MKCAFLPLGFMLRRSENLVNIGLKSAKRDGLISTWEHNNRPTDRVTLQHCHSRIDVINKRSMIDTAMQIAVEISLI